MNVLRPSEIVDVEGDVVFEAGPIQDAPNWQDEAIEILGELDSGLTIACPRKDYAPGEFVYEAQVDWETHYLNRAARCGAIMFWLAKEADKSVWRGVIEDLGAAVSRLLFWKEHAHRRPYAQTSRFELGEWKMRHQTDGTKLVVGIERGFGNERYIRRRFGQDCPDVPILDNLPDTCEAVVEIL